MSAVRAATSSTTATCVVEEEEAVIPVTLRRVHLRHENGKKKVIWTPDTVDNEHLGKKSSKICCVYHKPRAFDESDSEESDFEFPPRDRDADGGAGDGGDKERPGAGDPYDFWPPDKRKAAASGGGGAASGGGEASAS